MFSEVPYRSIDLVEIHVSASSLNFTFFIMLNRPTSCIIRTVGFVSLPAPFLLFETIEWSADVD